MKIIIKSKNKNKVLMVCENVKFLENKPIDYLEAMKVKDGNGYKWLSYIFTEDFYFEIEKNIEEKPEVSVIGTSKIQNIMKNWRTTLIGLISAIAVALLPLAKDKPINLKEDWFVYLLSAIIAVTGYFMNDNILTSKNKKR